MAFAAVGSAFGGLPVEVRVEPLVDGARFVLPPRRLGKARWVGLVPMLFGCVFAAGAVAWMAGAAWAAFANKAQFDLFEVVFGLFFVLFGVPFVLAGLFFVAVGLFIMAGRSEAIVTRGRLYAIDRAGPFRWTRSRPVDAVRRLVVAGGVAKINGEPVKSGALADLYGIKAECEGAKSMAIAIVYPRSIVWPLANELARLCDAEEPRPLFDADEQTVQVVEEPIKIDSAKLLGVSADTNADVLEKPASSRVLLEEHPDGVTLRVPSAGIRRASKGLFGFGIVWCLFMVVFTGGWVFAGEDAPWFLWLIIALFWAVGVGMLLGAINMGRRRAVIAVVGQTLMLLTTGIFGSKRREWTGEQVRAIRVGPSGIEVNGRPVLELQVLPQSGGKFGLLAGRDEQELRWIATVLRRALGLTPKT